MKNNFLTLVMAACLMATVSGCYTMKHTVGNGGTGAGETTERQWYALWGLVPLGEADGGELAGNAQDYTVTTQLSPMDFVLNLFTTWVTITSRTVTVTR